MNPLYNESLVLPPKSHLDLGVGISNSLVRLDVNGEADDEGEVVSLVTGMSNFNQETRMFLKLYRSRKAKMINACRGGWDISRMVNQADAFWAWLVNKKLIGRDPANPTFGRKQVQILIFKDSLAKPGRNLPALPLEDHSKLFGTYLHLFLERAKVELPNLRLVYLSSGIYAGHAAPTAVRIEPNTHGEGVVIDELIKNNYGRTDPWIVWGPYLWADGLTPRADGLVWTIADFEADRIHPSASGELKVANMMKIVLDNHPATTWYR